MNKRLIDFVKPQKALLVLACLSACIAVFFMLLIPVLMGWAIDTFLDPASIVWQRLAFWILCILISTVFVVVFQGIVVLSTSKLSYGVARDLRDACARKLNKLPLSFYDETPHGDIVSRIVNDCDAVADGLLQGLQQFLTGILTVLGTLVFMFFLSVPIAIVVLVVTPLSVCIASAITKSSSQHFAAQQQLQGELAAFAEEHIAAQKLISLYSVGEIAEQEFRAINETLYTVGEKAQFVSSLSNPGTRFANNIVYAIVAVIGCMAAITSFPAALSVGSIQAFLSYTAQYTKPFNDITSVLAQIQTAKASSSRLFTFLNEPEEVPDKKTALNRLGPIQGEVAFDKVSFSYTPNTSFIEDMTWVALPGQKIALVGPTGCGKTTLINLLLRFYEIDTGTISLDKTSTQDIKRDTLRRAFGMVLQDSWLFEGTVLENIRFSRPSATKGEVEEAAKRALADDFIRQLPRGYDTYLEEDGRSLSEGQKQLLCIARVMLQNPALLILDEATSSIDSRTEVLVQAAFESITENKTSIIVAHRLSTIKNADCILVMKDGRIIERGTHEELLLQGGFYKELYEAQWKESATSQEAS